MLALTGRIGARLFGAIGLGSRPFSVESILYRAVVQRRRLEVLLLVDWCGILDRSGPPKLIDISFFGQQELQERLRLEAAGLGDGQQEQVLGATFLKNVPEIFLCMANCLIALSAMLLFQGMPSWPRKVNRLCR